MKVLKDPFIIASIAIVLVGGVLWMVVRSGNIASLNEHREDLVKVSSKYGQYSRKPPYINKTIVTATKEEVALLEEEAAAVKDEFLKVNRGRYKVLTLSAADESVPAFPIDRQKYADHGLEFDFTRRYQAALGELLATLNPTFVPSEAEILDTQARVRGEQELKSGTEGAAPAPVPSGPNYGRPDFFRRRGIPRPYVPGETSPMPTPGVDQPVEESAEELAIKQLIRTKSFAGSIYANMDSLHVVLLSQQTKYNFEALWDAQVNLWVLGDIVAAINATNKQASVPRGVPGAAIKRLVSSNVRGYVVNVAPSEDSEDESRQSTGLRYIRGLGGMSSEASDPPALTGRACNPLYDVVHYDFTVIMPSRHLLKLYTNLMAQKHHTILDVRLTQCNRGGDSARSGADEAGVSEEMFYYGTDPVMQVSITGEVLLLTEWSRGPLDKENSGRVAATALMPDQFLKKLSVANAAIMREGEEGENWEAIKVEGGVVPGGGGVRPGPTGGRGGRYGRGPMDRGGRYIPRR